MHTQTLVKSWLCAVLVAFGAGVAGAQTTAPSYRAEDVVRHFEPELGAPRGICVGTQADCRPVARRPAANFDLLVNFDLNSDVLTEGARRNLEEFAQALRDPRLGPLRFEVQGHTDARGSEALNQDLSQRRAQAVIRFLSERGIETARLVPRAFGQTQPRVADPFDPVNRRVETRLLP